MINVLGKVRIHLKEKKRLYLYLAQYGGMIILYLVERLGFRLWAENGVWKLKDLYKDGVLMSFTDITDKFKIPKKHYYKYLQIRNFIRTAY